METKKQGHVEIRSCDETPFLIAVVGVAENGREISEDLHQNLSNAKTNIRANLELYGGKSVEVRDVRKPEEVVKFIINVDGTVTPIGNVGGLEILEDIKPENE